MTAKISAFLDTSALFAGIWSSTGGSRKILKLGEAGLVEILLSSQVLKEIESVIKKKSPDNIGYLTLLLDRSGVRVVVNPNEDLIKRCINYVAHPGDAEVTAAAWSNQVDFFVTLDRKHFINIQSLTEKVPFPIGTPGDFLTWYREQLTRLQVN